MPGTAATARGETEAKFLPLALGALAPPSGLSWAERGLIREAWPGWCLARSGQGRVGCALSLPEAGRGGQGGEMGQLLAEALATFTRIH